MDDDHVMPRTDGLWTPESRSLQIKVSYPLGLESGLQPWPLPTPACPASPPSALRLPESPGALLLEKGPALGEGGTKWVG